MCEETIDETEGFFHCKECKTDNHYECDPKKMKTARKALIENKDIIKNNHWEDWDEKREERMRRNNLNNLTNVKEDAVEESIEDKAAEKSEEENVPDIKKGYYKNDSNESRSDSGESGSDSNDSGSGSNDSGSESNVSSIDPEQKPTIITKSNII